MRTKIVLLILLLIPSTLFPQGTDETSGASRYDSYAGKTSMGPSIVASTSWVGAIAEAAGAEDVLVLAPIELRHPPEYDFSPQDIIKASQADLLLWAGYEGFMKKLRQAAEISEHKLIQVQTNNAPDKLSESVKAMAELLGTQTRFALWNERLEKLASSLQEGASFKKAGETTVAVQFHQQAIARYLGYDVVAVFGPQELTMNDITHIESLDPELIIDNWHSPQGLPLEKDGRGYVQLINFPGPFATSTLLEVLAYNGKALGLID